MNDQRRRPSPLSYRVNGGLLRKTSQHHGISSHELRRMSGAIQHLRDCGEIENLWWAVVGDELLELPPCQAMTGIQLVRHRINLLQKRASLPQYCMTVLEVDPQLHGNLLYLGTPEMAETIRKAAPAYFRGEKAIQHVDDLPYVTNYLSKERTSRASVALGMARKRGTYPLIIDGTRRELGDRVRLSDELARDAVDAGRVEEWKRTNASLKPPASDRRKGNSGRRSATPAQPLPPVTSGPETKIRPTGQLLMFPAMERPVVRLHDYRGGLMPKTVAMEVEHRRHTMGITQAELARRAMISRPQLANVCAGRFGLDTWAANRLREVLLYGDAGRLAA